MPGAIVFFLPCRSERAREREREGEHGRERERERERASTGERERERERASMRKRDLVGTSKWRNVRKKETGFLLAECGGDRWMREIELRIHIMVILPILPKIRPKVRIVGKVGKLKLL